jgi:hypothetical protein
VAHRSLSSFIIGLSSFSLIIYYISTCSNVHFVPVLAMYEENASGAGVTPGGFGRFSDKTIFVSITGLIPSRTNCEILSGTGDSGTEGEATAPKASRPSRDSSC